MEQPNRFLLISALVILAATLITVIAVLVANAGHQVPALAENTPEGRVQRFFIALDEDDYLQAYNYILPSAKNGTFEMWKSPVFGFGERPAFRVSLEDSAINGNSATVQVIIETFRAGSPFSSGISTQHIVFSLQLQNGTWWIVAPTDIWWLMY